MGVSLTKEFIKSPANTISLDVSNYKIVKPFQFACNLMHVGRDKKVAVGMLTDADNVIISPAFTVFETINNNVILPEVLVSWFSQSFFDNEVSYLATYSDEALELMRDNCSELRDLAMIDMLASTGMRVGEMVLLNREDIDFNERECVVFGKSGNPHESGGKQRRVLQSAERSAAASRVRRFQTGAFKHHCRRT